MLYSLCSTAFAGALVSVSMVNEGISELENFTDEYDAKDDNGILEDIIAELQDIIAELQEIADNPEENCTLHLRGEDTDAGFATWLQNEDDSENEELEENKDLFDCLSDEDEEGIGLYGQEG